MEAEEAVQSFATSLCGRLRLAVPRAFGTCYLPPVLTHFSQRYPDLNMDIDHEDRVVNLHEEYLDIAIRIGELAGSSLKSKTLPLTDTFFAPTQTTLPLRAASGRRSGTDYAGQLFARCVNRAVKKGASKNVFNAATGNKRQCC